MSTHWIRNTLLSSDARLSHIWTIYVDLVIRGYHTAHFDKSINGRPLHSASYICALQVEFALVL